MTRPKRRPLRFLPDRGRLKAWGDREWSAKLTRTLAVSMVDGNIPIDHRGRKRWYLALTQSGDLLREKGGARGLPKGRTLLLSAADVAALTEYLLPLLMETGDLRADARNRVSPTYTEQPGDRTRTARKGRR